MHRSRFILKAWFRLHLAAICKLAQWGFRCWHNWFRVKERPLEPCDPTRILYCSNDGFESLNLSVVLMLWPSGVHQWWMSDDCWALLILTLACQLGGWCKDWSWCWQQVEGQFLSFPFPVRRPLSACGSDPAAGSERQVPTAARRHNSYLKTLTREATIYMWAIWWFKCETLRTSVTERMKPFHSSRASALGTWRDNGSKKKCQN